MAKDNYNGWGNEATWSVWTFISNDSDIYGTIKASVRSIHEKSMNTSRFSRRDDALSKVATMLRGIVEDEIKQNPWWIAAPVWSKSVINEGIERVDWHSMSILLINSHEFVHGQDGRL